jgi:uncharacterized protein YndB with AHSA1/START domain
MENRTEMARPQSVADGATAIAVARLAMPPASAFRAFTTSDLERWWGEPPLYMTEWTADRRPGRKWRVVVDMTGAEVNPPHELVMTRQYTGDHPTLGQRATTVTHRFEETAGGMRAIVRHDGFVGAPGRRRARRRLGARARLPAGRRRSPAR